MSALATKAELLGELIDQLRNNGDAWRMDGSNFDSVLVHDSGVMLWVYLGSAHVWKPCLIKFDFWDQHRLRRAYRQWRRVHGRRKEQEREASAIADCLGMLRRAAA